MDGITSGEHPLMSTSPGIGLSDPEPLSAIEPSLQFSNGRTSNSPLMPVPEPSFSSWNHRFPETTLTTPAELGLLSPQIDSRNSTPQIAVNELDRLTGFEPSTAPLIGEFDPDVLLVPKALPQALTGDQTVDDTIVDENITISGDVVLNVTGDFTLSSLGIIAGDGIGPADNLIIKSEGTVIIDGLIGGGGLQNLIIESNDIKIFNTLNVLGDIRLTAESQAEESNLEVPNLENLVGEFTNQLYQTEIEINNALLSGQTITIEAKSRPNSFLQGTSDPSETDGVGLNLESSAKVSIGGTSQIIGTRDVTITAESRVNTNIQAEAVGEGDTSIDAAVAGAVVKSSAIAHVSGAARITIGGTFVLHSINDTNLKTTANGKAEDSGTQGGTVAVTTLEKTTEAYVSDSASIEAANIQVLATSTGRVETNATSTAQGATQNSANTQGLLQANAQTNGGTMGVAAALAIAILKDNQTRAYISTSGPVTVTESSDVPLIDAPNRTITIRSISSTDSVVKADSIPTDGETGVGVAAAINQINTLNEAYIDGSVNLDADAIAIDALTHETPTQFTAEAYSGAGATDVGVAGALAINQVTTNHSNASIKAGSTLNANGATVTSNAENHTQNTAIARPQTNENGGQASDVGVGASVAVNVSKSSTRAEVEDNATLQAVNSLNLDADSQQTVTTSAQAGSTSDVVVDPVISLAFTQHDTLARIGTGDTLNVTNALNVNATHLDTIKTIATGQTAGDIGIGAAIAITDATDTTTATAARAVDAGGNVNVSGQSAASSQTQAIASPKGGKKDDGASTSGVDQQVNGALDFVQTQAGASEDRKKQSPSAAASEGTVNVAAAVAVNLSNSRVQAFVPAQGSVRSEGRLQIKALQNTNAMAIADGSPTKSEIGIGAAVAINDATAVNEAFIGQNATITAQGLTIEAGTANRNNGAESEKTSTFAAKATSGAGATDVGVAGALAFNQTSDVSRTHASIGNGALINVGDGDLAIQANHQRHAEAEATSQSQADSSSDSSVGVGASVALNTSNHRTEATIQENAAISQVRNLSVTAQSSDTTKTNAKGGAEGGVAVDASVAVADTQHVTHAHIAAGESLSAAGTILIRSNTTGETNETKAESAANGDVGVGASVAVITTDNTTSTTVDRSLITLGGDIEATAQSSRQYITNAKAGAKGAKSDSGNQGNAKSSQSLKEFGASTSEGQVQMAAAVGISSLNDDVNASISNSTLQAAGNLKTLAINQSDFTSKGNGNTAQGDVQVGVGVGITLLDNDTHAHLERTTVTQANDVTVTAQSKQNFSEGFSNTFGAEAIAGSSQSETVGVAGALALVKSKDSEETQAHLGDGVVIQNANNITIEANSTNRVSAKAWAGNLSDDGLGVGASVAVLDMYRANRALVGSGNQITANSLRVAAQQNRISADPFKFTNVKNLANDLAGLLRTNNYYTEALAGSAGQGGSLQVAGSFAVHTLNHTTEAYIGDNSTITTTNALSLTSLNDTQSRAIAGNVALTQGDVSVGVGNATQAITNLTQSYVGQSVVVNAGQIIIDANSDQDSWAIAVSAAGSTGVVAVAGSVSLTKIDNITHAYVETGSQLTTHPNGALTPVIGNQSITIKASDKTSTIGVGGALSLGDDVGVSGGVDISLVNKDTQAYLASSAQAIAADHIQIHAHSQEYMTSISASLGIGGTVGFAGSVGVSKLDLTTIASINDGATAHAEGNISVDADVQTEVDIFAGGVAAAGTVGVGASVVVPIIDKTTHARIGSGAEVSAKGLRDSLVAKTGEFDVNFVEQVASETEVGGPRTQLTKLVKKGDKSGNGSQYRDEYPSITFNQTENQIEREFGNWEDDGFKMEQRIQVSGSGSNDGMYEIVDIKGNGKVLVLSPTNRVLDEQIQGDAVMATLITGDVTVGATVENNGDENTGGVEQFEGRTSSAIAQQRVANARTLDIKGLAVTATNQDDLKSYAVAGSLAGTAAVSVAGNINVLTNETIARIDDGATVNRDTSDASGDQSVLVAAGTDLHHLGINGSAAFAGTASVAPAAGVAIFSNTTEASISTPNQFGNSAQVNANGDVYVSADASEEILSIGIGVAVSGTVAIAGSVSVVSLDNNTHAFIDDGATVWAGGNVLVTANDETKMDVVSGAAGIGILQRLLLE